MTPLDQLPPLSIVPHSRDALYAVLLIARVSFVGPLLVLFPIARGVAFAASCIFALSAPVVGESVSLEEAHAAILPAQCRGVAALSHPADDQIAPLAPFV